MPINNSAPHKMSREEVAERAKTALGCLEISVAALERAKHEMVGAMRKDLDITRANVALGGLQMKLLDVYDRAKAKKGGKA